MSQQQMQAISVEQAKRICPIIAIALMGGVVIALVFMFPFELFNGAIPKQGINFPGTFIAISELVLLMFLPGFVSNAMLAEKGKTTSEQDFYPAAYQTEMIIRYALLESAAFANIFFVTDENFQISLGTVAFLLLVMIFYFPTPGRIDAWIKNKKELAGFEQQDADTF